MHLTFRLFELFSLDLRLFDFNGESGLFTLLYIDITFREILLHFSTLHMEWYEDGLLYFIIFIEGQVGWGESKRMSSLTWTDHSGFGLIKEKD